MRKKWIIVTVAAVIGLWIISWTVIAIMDGDYLSAVAFSGVASVFGWMVLGQKGRLDESEPQADSDDTPDEPST